MSSSSASDSSTPSSVLKDPTPPRVLPPPTSLSARIVRALDPYGNLGYVVAFFIAFSLSMSVVHAMIVPSQSKTARNEVGYEFPDNSLFIEAPQLQEMFRIYGAEGRRRYMQVFVPFDMMVMIPVYTAWFLFGMVMAIKLARGPESSPQNNPTIAVATKTTTSASKAKDKSGKKLKSSSSSSPYPLSPDRYSFWIYLIPPIPICDVIENISSYLLMQSFPSKVDSTNLFDIYWYSLHIKHIFLTAGVGVFLILLIKGWKEERKEGRRKAIQAYLEAMREKQD